MSTYTQTDSGSNATNFTYDYSKIFLRNIITRTINIAASGSDLELSAGQLIGTIAATAKGAVMKSGSSDGSEYPTGIVLEDITITDGDNQDVTIVIAGEVAKDELIFDGTDGLETSVSDRIYLDRLAAQGIIVRDSEELTTL